MERGIEGCEVLPYPMVLKWSCTFAVSLGFLKARNQVLTAVAWGKLPVHLHVKAVYWFGTSCGVVQQFAKGNQAQGSDLPTSWRLWSATVSGCGSTLMSPCWGRRMFLITSCPLQQKSCLCCYFLLSVAVMTSFHLIPLTLNLKMVFSMLREQRAKREWESGCGVGF